MARLTWSGSKQAMAEHKAADRATKPRKKRKKLTKVQRRRIRERKAKRPVNYKAYIHSKAWQTKRRMMFALYDCCALCGSKENLQVHHLHYDTLGKETAKDLAVVCLTCHEDLHGRSFTDRNQT